MKKYSTRVLKLIASLYLGFPFTFLVIAAILFDLPGKEVVGVLLTPGYWILCSFCIVAGYGLLEMKRWSWYVFIPANIFCAYFAVLVAIERGESHHKAVAIAIALIVIAYVTYRVSREVRVPYFLPKIRWWESNPRYKLSVAAQIERSSDLTRVEGEILDLSMGGCFLKLKSVLREDEEITLSFKLFGEELRLSGNVVWRTESGVTHPKGVGIKFLPLKGAERRVMRAAHRRLKQISVLYRTSRYLLSQEEFFKKVESLQNERLVSNK